LNAVEEREEEQPSNPLEPQQAEHHEAESSSLPLLMLAAIGIVFGDFGSSPIYAVRESLLTVSDARGVSRGDVFGILSLIVWALILVVTVKYVSFVTRADNHGEGGTLSLMALARSGAQQSRLILWLGVVGASLFCGDAVITPAISVLSAIEGLEVATPNLTPYVVPVTVVILLALFFVQRYGTHRVASVFGPVMSLWFLVLAVSGALHIADHPSVLLAVNPYYAVAFVAGHPGVAFVTLGAVFLAVTGAEALYADLGHFGRRPIVMAWLMAVFPCLLLTYFGQAAYVLKRGAIGENLFFEMQPDWAVLPVVLLATAATVIASQAVISGAFSLARQAVHLNLLPRFNIRHTSETQLGQVYLARVNFLVCVVVIGLVLGFQRSGALASAYGIAVTGEMLVTAMLLAVVMRRIWNWRLALVIPLIALFLLIDGIFFAANALKVAEGGWVSLAVAGFVGLMMYVWIRGSDYLWSKTRRTDVPLSDLIAKLKNEPPTIISGTAVFLTSDPENAPSALIRSHRHYKVLHESNINVQVTTAPQPVVPASERAKIEKVDEHFHTVVLTFGYMERPNVPDSLNEAANAGLPFDAKEASYFLSRRTLLPSGDYGLPLWQDRIYILLSRTSDDATHYFQVPIGRVVEVGTQIRF
jgi:KUP system potassium uptake protein